MLQNNSKLLHLTKEYLQILQKQAISNEAPGSILKDFDTLLDIIGEKGIETGGKYDLFSMGKLAEINAQLTHSVRLSLKLLNKNHSLMSTAYIYYYVLLVLFFLKILGKNVFWYWMKLFFNRGVV